MAASRWRWTLSCCSSSWFGCQSFMMTLSMLSAYTVCVGMTSLCTCRENASTSRHTLAIRGRSTTHGKDTQTYKLNRGTLNPDAADEKTGNNEALK